MCAKASRGPTEEALTILRSNSSGQIRTRIFIGAIVAQLLLASVASAQTEGFQGGLANPDVKTRAAVPGVDPGAPAPAAPSTGTAPAPEGADQGDATEVAKKLTSVQFSGNTRISSETLGEIAKPYLGKSLTLGGVKDLTNKVKNAYRDKGYLLAKAIAPDQDPDAAGGLLKIEVVEGHYGKLLVQGNKHYSTEFIERFFRPAMRDGLVRERPLLRSVLVLREFSDLVVRSNFTASETPGASDVTLVVTDDRPFHFGFDYSNFGNIFVGQNRVGASVWAGSLILEGDELFAKITEPFPTKSDPFYTTTYQAPIGDRGDRMSFSYAGAKTRVGRNLANLDIRGEADIFVLSWVHPIQRGVSDSSTLTSSFVAKTIKNFFFGNQLTSDDELRMLTVTLDGSKSHAKARTLYNATLTTGLGESFGGSPNNNTAASTQGAGNDFSKINGEVFHIITLKDQQFILLRANAQGATNQLATAEQYSIGGPDSCRGYTQSEFLGDEGYTAGAEYRKSLIQKTNLAVQGVAFIDHAHASLISPLVGQTARQSLTGAGVGTRAAFAKYYSLRLDLGFPLARNNAKNDEPLLYAQLISRF